MLRTTVTGEGVGLHKVQQILTHFLPLPSSHTPNADITIDRGAASAKPRCCLTLFFNTTSYETTTKSSMLAQG